DVYVVPIDGHAAPVRLSGPTPAGALVNDLVLSPDGTRVAYAAESGTTRSLMIAPTDASAPAQQLSAAGEDRLGQFGRLKFTADGNRVVYVAVAGRLFRLFSTLADGSGGHVQLSTGGDLQQQYETDWIVVAPTGWAVFVAQTGASTGVFGVPIDGRAPAVRLDSAQPYAGAP